MVLRHSHFGLALQDSSPYGYEPPDPEPGYDLHPVEYEPGLLSEWFSGQPSWVFFAFVVVALSALWGGVWYWRRDLFKSERWDLDLADRQLVFSAILVTVTFVAYVVISLLA